MKLRRKFIGARSRGRSAAPASPAALAVHVADDRRCGGWHRGRPACRWSRAGSVAPRPLTRHAVARDAGQHVGHRLRARQRQLPVGREAQAVDRLVVGIAEHLDSALLAGHRLRDRCDDRLEARPAPSALPEANMPALWMRTISVGAAPITSTCAPRSAAPVAAQRVERAGATLRQRGGARHRQRRRPVRRRVGQGLQRAVGGAVQQIGEQQVAGDQQRRGERQAMVHSATDERSGRCRASTPRQCGDSSRSKSP